MILVKTIIFWITCLFLALVFFPLNLLIRLLTLPFDGKKVIVHRLLTFQSSIIVKLIPFWKVITEGREKAKKGTPYVIISNHQSMLDVLFLNSLHYNYKWISKIENSKVPVIGWYLKMAGYITILRGDDASKAVMFDKSLHCLSQGISIMIFPEGTRSVNNEIGFFKKGAFQMAQMADVPILPILVDGTGEFLPKHARLIGKNSTIRIRVLDPVYPASFGNEDPVIIAGEFQKYMTAELNKLRMKTDAVK